MYQCIHLCTHSMVTGLCQHGLTLNYLVPNEALEGVLVTQSVHGTVFQILIELVTYFQKY